MIYLTQIFLSAPIQDCIKMGPFHLNPEIKAGDLLTPITVFVSVLTFAWTIRKDMNSRQRAEADLVRAAVAKALGRLERWKELALWYYRDVQPTLVETSDMLAKEFDVDKARDHLWSALQAAHVVSGERLLNEALETAFVELSSAYPGIYDAFGKTIAEMKALDVEAHGELLTLTQAAVLNYRTRQNNYLPPLLGNDLRQCANAASAYLSQQLDAIVQPVRTFLVKSIRQSDQELLRSKRSETEIPGPSGRPYQSMAEFLHKHSTSQRQPSDRTGEAQKTLG